MNNLNSNIVDYYKRNKKGDSIEGNEYVNLPDLQFFLWCNKNFRLNRGIYNTIDSWLYDLGIHHIIVRRIYLIAFLDFVKETLPEERNQKFLRFGNGGLTRKLQQFIDETENQALYRFK